MYHMQVHVQLPDNEKWTDYLIFVLSSASTEWIEEKLRKSISNAQFLPQGRAQAHKRAQGPQMRKQPMRRGCRCGKIVGLSPHWLVTSSLMTDSPPLSVSK